MVTRKFCFICGKVTDDLVEGRCIDCRGEDKFLIVVPKKFELVVCSRCSRVKDNNRWQDISVEEVLNKKVKTNGRITNFEIIQEGKFYYADAKGYPEGSTKLKEEKERIPVHINKLVCSKCNMRWGGYYEAIIQIRGNYTQKAIAITEGIVARLEGKDEKAFISKIVKVRGGVDYYLGSKRIATKIADELKKEFDAEIKRSFELVTQREGKDVHRNIISVRI
jgi:nonsense-mediated mRNA decay protein 3